MRSVVIVAFFAVLLCACDGEQQELKDWMAEVKANTKVSVSPLSEPKKYEPYAYRLRDSLDPFNLEKIAAAQAKLQARSSSGVRPNMDRRREPLEAFPLDTLTMVGALVQNKRVFGLLRLEKNLHKVSVGNYLGQNFGKIVGITETEITLKEIVQDAAGEWTERVSKLQLQEEKK